MSVGPRTLVQNDGMVFYLSTEGAFQAVGLIERTALGEWEYAGVATAGTAELRRDAVAALVAAALDVGVVQP